MSTYKSESPLFIPLAIGLFIFVGACTLTIDRGGVGYDIYLSGYWVGLILIAYFFRYIRRFDRATSPDIATINVEQRKFQLLLFWFVFINSVMYYLGAGIPLLSDNPDVARMEFMQSGFSYKLIKIFLPFSIVYFSAIFFLKGHKGYDFIPVLLLVIVQLLTGGKGAAIWAALFVLLGYYVSGEKVSVGKVLKILPFVILFTLILFYIVLDVDSFWDAALFLLQRITSIAAFGLHVLVNDLNGLFISSDPFRFAVDVYNKYFVSGYSEFTPSFGRHVTAQFYGGDVYDFIWELTVTIFGDFYVIGGVVGGMLLLTIYFLLTEYVWNKSQCQNSLYVKTFFVVIWYHMILFVLTGSLITEFFVRTLPFILFAGLGYGFLILMNGILSRD